MDIITEKTNGVIIMKVEIDVMDAGNTDAFKAAISPLLNGNNRVLLDLTRLTFIDSSGCGTLLSIYNRVKSSGGMLKIYGVQEQILEIFDLIRLDRIIDVFKTKEAALKEF
jgi:anti-sigma B factor antagonist